MRDWLHLTKPRSYKGSLAPWIDEIVRLHDEGNDVNAITKHLLAIPAVRQHITGIFSVYPYQSVYNAIRHALMRVGKLPPPRPQAEYYEYHRARYEHAWLLRAEGLLYKQIGRRLGISVARTQQMVTRYGIRARRATRRTRWRFDALSDSHS